jgi:hypothetical protein
VIQATFIGRWQYAQIRAFGAFAYPHAGHSTVAEGAVAFFPSTGAGVFAVACTGEWTEAEALGGAVIVE